MRWRRQSGRGRGWLLGGLGFLACLRPVDEGTAAPQGEVPSVVTAEAPTDDALDTLATEPEPPRADDDVEDASATLEDAEATRTPADERPLAVEGADPVAAGEADPELLAAATPVRRLLRLSERRIAQRLGRAGEPGEGGWRHYGEPVAVRFEAGRSVAVALRVPGGLSCEAAARWAGFPEATAPLRQASACSWPGISDRHRLAPGIVGELELTAGVFHVWLP